jgi:hypothetical protein
LYFHEWKTGEQGNAIVGFLTEGCESVPEIFERLARKEWILSLGFLKTNDVRLVGCKPLEEVGKPRTDGVDVPSRNP